MTASTIYHQFNEYLQEFDFCLPDHTFHGLRHAFATGMAMKNVPLPIIQKLMGHASAATTAKYIHVPEELTTSLPDLIDGDDYETLV